MGQDPIRVMVVDDSAVMRNLICDKIETTPNLKVAYRATNGKIAVDRHLSVCPDVITMDVEMPQMNGLEAVRRILAERPVPIIMCSHLTQRGADITFDALEAGAVDWVSKSTRRDDFQRMLDVHLIPKIIRLSSVDATQLVARRPATIRASASQSKNSQPAANSRQCICIGISTGGPPALCTLFAELTPPMPPILVVQHMPKGFTKPFADRLNRRSEIKVKEVADGDFVTPNHAYIAMAGTHMRLAQKQGRAILLTEQSDTVSGHRPSVDVIMRDVAKFYGESCVGVIMTGMGSDGVDGCRAIRETGGIVLGQDQASSDVYGMNRVAHERGHVDQQFALDQAAEVIQAAVKSKPASEAQSV